MRSFRILTIVAIFVSLAISIYFYPQVPEQMASHWNIKGEVDGYLPKSWGLFLMPVISVGLYLLLIFIPKIDPLKENIKKFRLYYEGFIFALIVFLLYIHFLSILWNVGYRFDIGQLMLPALGIFFYYLGVLTEKSKRNWFIGIRTPWTLLSDKVWEKTHRLGGKLFKISGIIALFGIIAPQYAFYLFFVPVIGTAVFTMIYSYFEFQKEKRK